MPDDGLYVGQPIKRDCQGHHRVDAVHVNNPKEKLLWLPGTDNGKCVHYTPNLSMWQWISNWVCERVFHSSTWVPVNIQWLQGDVQRERDVLVTEPGKHPESRQVVYIKLSDLEQVEIKGRSIKDREIVMGYIVETTPGEVAMRINQLVATLPYQSNPPK
jgi:hypothetical protein